MKILIMAGGRGERFWPLSTKEKPKQLLPILTNKSMIRETVDRALGLAELKDIFVATNETQVEAIKNELHDLPKQNILIEPSFKDTAAAISYGSMIISKKSDNPLIVVLASDHLISDIEKFRIMIKKAEAEANKGYIVTLGIKPEKPETAYGYIKIQRPEIGVPSKAERFMEKPNYETAEKYIYDGNYVWNSGIFVFKYNVIMQEIKKYLPNHYNVFNELSILIDNKSNIEISNISRTYFDKLEKISIDFAVMEKSHIIKCIPVDFGWNDVGNFTALEDILEKDSNGNVIKDCTFKYIDSNNNIVVGDNKQRLITSIGVDDLVIVETRYALLIFKKKEYQKVKKIVDLIEEEKA